ncbi:MAG: hypothetical protein JW717_14475 [Marinilabiliaceae bacterium]|nr:hypothetical protein [Marinilabiliaceae bacterium]
MKHKNNHLINTLLIIVIALLIVSCNKIKELDDKNPDLKMLEDGFKVSAAIGYCASLTHLVLTGNSVPDNIIFTAKESNFSNAGLIYINITSDNPLPYNNQIGDIIIGAIWDKQSQSGVMTVIFGNIDLINTQYKFYGVHTIPFIVEEETGNITTVFAKQDIVLGNGNDTILNLSFTNPQFNLETDRARETPPQNVFVAVSQNVWFVTVNQNQENLLYDDDYYINGGGQMIEATSTDGGITYHALIDTRFNYSKCSVNPLHGTGFIQKIKAGSGIDLGNITIDFHNSCDGKGYVTFALGTYILYLNKDVNLNF